MKRGFVFILFFLLQPRLAHAHSGGLDARGCHHVRATGEYHCHRGQAAPRPLPGPAARSTPAPPVHPPVPEPSPPFSSPPADPDWIAVTLTSIVDGDTIHVADASGRPIKVRLYGIDTPERDQPGGAEATEAQRRLLTGRRLAIRILDRDRRREVALVAADGAPVNETLIRQGYAWAFTRYCRLDFCAAWELAEFVALGSGLGIWRLPPPAIPPWDWRRGRGKAKLPFR